MIVFVVGFHPSVVGGSSGGFEWRYSRQDAIKVAVELLIDAAQEDRYHGSNIVFAAIEVPFEVNPARPRAYDDREHEITRWIDDNIHLIELPLQHEAEPVWPGEARFSGS